MTRAPRTSPAGRSGGWRAASSSAGQYQSTPSTRAHAKAAVWPAARCSSTPHATGARQSAAGAQRTTDSHRTAARRVDADGALAPRQAQHAPFVWHLCRLFVMARAPPVLSGSVGVGDRLHKRPAGRMPDCTVRRIMHLTTLARAVLHGAAAVLVCSIAFGQSPSSPPQTTGAGGQSSPRFDGKWLAKLACPAKVNTEG